MTTNMADAQEDVPAEETAEESKAETEEVPEENSEAAAESQEEPKGGEDEEAEVKTEEAEEAPPPTEGEEAEEEKKNADGEGEVAEGEDAEGDGKTEAEGDAATAEAAEEQQPGETAEATDAADAGEAVDSEKAADAVDGVEPTEAAEAEPSAEAEEKTEGEASAEAGDDAAAAKEGEEAEGEEGEKPEGEAEEGGEKKEEDEGEEGEKKEAEEGEDGEKKEEDEDKPEGQAEEAGEEATQEEQEKAVEEVEGEVPERAESPVGVGEKLSRGPTPDATDAPQLEQERLEATTPDRMGEMAQETTLAEEYIGPVEEEEEEMVEPAFRREDLIERYHEALSEREQLQQQNFNFQHRLAEYFRKKKADERQDYDKNVTDQEQRYLKYMAQLEELRRQDSREKEDYQVQIEDAQERCKEKKEKVDMERRKFMEYKKQVALNAINSRSGKPIPAKDIDQYMVNEVKKETEVVNVRLENIKLKNKLKKKEQQLKSKEELAEGLHLIDFEQLKIENQTYNEKIEERNEELLKLRKKITSTVQVLTHLKEKLQYVQGENLEQSNQLKVVEQNLAQSRDVLSRTKQARDALRIDNQKLRQNCGLLGNEPLLRDFEERKDEGEELKSRLEKLRMRHAELTLHCNQVRRKIDQARQPVA